MSDSEGPGSPTVAALVGELAFFPGLTAALGQCGCEVRRVPTLAEAGHDLDRALVIVDGDDHLRSGLDRVREFHRRGRGAPSPVLLLVRGPATPTLALTYDEGPLDAIGTGAGADALTLRLRCLAALARRGVPRTTDASLRAAIVGAPDGVAVVSSGGDVEFTNHAFLSMLDAENDADATEILRDLTVPGDVAVPFLTRVPIDGTPWRGDLTRVSRPLLVELTATAWRREEVDGTETIVVILQDVTRLRLLEKNLAEAQRMDAVGQLAGGVAHDFNNILSVITTLSDLLMRLRPADDPDREDLQEIFDSAQRGSEIARQLSAFSRPGRGEPEVLDLNSIVRASEKMLRRLLGESIEISLELDPDVGVLRADPIHLEQLILNLALNARDAMPNGGAATIATGVRGLSETLETATGVLAPGTYVVLEVRDTGQGMDDSTRQRLFEPFYTTREWGRHSGLGLSVVYGVVVGVHGGIQIESTLGQGTTLRVFLPASDTGADDAAHSRSTGTPAVGANRLRSSPTVAETILVVEDHRRVREGLARALEAIGYRVLTASSGSEALALLREDGVRPQLVLSDVVMPSQDGIHLEAGIRDLGLAVPLVFMSGHPDHPEVDRLRRSGVRVLAKPIDLEMLERIVRDRLDDPPH